jgi:ankyrin repeat protein
VPRRRADAGRLTNEDVTPALAALYRGDEAEGKRLLPPEANVFEAAAFGLAPRLRELVETNPELARRRAADDFTPLHLAAFFGRPEAVALLLRVGAGVEAEATNSFLARVRPLHSAAAGGHLECCRLLVDAGADVNAQQGGGGTPLAAARANGDEALVALLVDAGAG